MLMTLIVLSVDYTEGGHYTVNKFVSEDEIIAVHEDSIQRRTLWPTFDHGVILVLLKKLHTQPPLSAENERYQESLGKSCCVYDRDQTRLLYKRQMSKKFLLLFLNYICQIVSCVVFSNAIPAVNQIISRSQ